jgi:hypothetical protein
VPQPTPTTLTGLLRNLASYPTLDSVVGSVVLDTGSKVVTLQTTKRIDALVQSYSKDIDLQVK